MAQTPRQLTVFAPAKVNLHLAVKNRRQDGFHDIESVFLAVDFGDTLHFELKEESEAAPIILMEGLDFPLPPEKNIISRALSLFREKTGFNRALVVKVEKLIPLGGGLGGGSSDAAATLIAINKLAGSPLNKAELLELAAVLGSDVPFFIHETAAAEVTGRGENIRPLEAPGIFLTLVNPGFPSDTAAAFRLFDEYGKKEPGAKKVEKMTIVTDPEKWDFFNDFLPVFGEREKAVYSEIIFSLGEMGALFAGLSGAGSTCFGVFRESGGAQKAAEALRAKRPFALHCGVWSGGKVVKKAQ